MQTENPSNLGLITALGTLDALDTPPATRTIAPVLAVLRERSWVVTSTAELVAARARGATLTPMSAHVAAIVTERTRQVTSSASLVLSRLPLHVRRGGAW